jgi:hypothetical protein
MPTAAMTKCPMKNDANDEILLRFPKIAIDSKTAIYI